MMSEWRPREYLKFGDERTRPARDLVSNVPLRAPRLIYDLGCGPGNSTAVLQSSYPDAQIIGVDSSESMLAEARRALPDNLFVAADLRAWTPPRPVDLLFSNATFQWLDNHASIMERLMGGLVSGGVLAVQMPDNLNEPSHVLMRETAARRPWAEKLSKAARSRAALAPPQTYYNLLKPHAISVDIWHVIYNHVLDGPGAIVEWVKTTGLRPFLDPLNAEEREGYLALYSAKIAKAYPPATDGKVLLRFPRLFIVATRR